ncbi:MAG TPA: serine/threonine-protein kinase, partial [Anaerolineales bacterium]|nr:serine/threonine-protein kinase [Anaerolineales bacterium]
MTPEKIGRYEIRAELGRGGMANVYRGYDPRFKREVAVKLLPVEFLRDPQFRARFEREAEVIAALEHPAIVPVYDYGEDAEAGQPYIVMRLMTGGSLAERLERGPLSLAETARIFSRLAPALDRAHARGIIHRDLKPGNILFDDDDNPYISDFGIAKLTEGGSTFTGSGVVGTPAYMSPEQARGEKHIDGRSDIYALGAIVFQMLTGKFPYEADTPMGIIVKHITDPVPHILDANADLPSGCEDLIQKAMAKRPADRFPKAVDLSRTLESIATGTYTPAVVPPTLQVDRATIESAAQVEQRAREAEAKAEQERIAREEAAAARLERERAEREHAERVAKEAAQAQAERARMQSHSAAAFQAAQAQAERAAREKAETGPTPKRQPTIEAAARQTIATPKLAEAPTKKTNPNMAVIIGSVIVVMLCAVGGIAAIAFSANTLRSARQTATPVQMAIPATGIAGSSNEQIAFVSN